MKDNLRNSLRSAFLEAAFVVFGVVLALAANEWRQNVKAQGLADAALVTIVAELRSNQELVQASRLYHEESVTAIQVKLRSGEKVIAEDFPRGFINPAWTTDTAWGVAQETGVLADFEYETLLTLSATYDRLERYNKQSDLVGQLVYGKMFSSGMQGVVENPANLMTIIYTFIFREKQVEEELATTLAQWSD